MIDDIFHLLQIPMIGCAAIGGLLIGLDGLSVLPIVLLIVAFLIAAVRFYMIKKYGCD